jgi:uncharacterized membrane protein YdbT with pleckstrin-like domain
MIGENIIEKHKPHPLAYFFYYLGGATLIFSSFFSSFFSSDWVETISTFLLGILVIGGSELLRRAETFYITETGVGREFRFVSTARTFAEYIKIQDVSVFQNIIDRIFGIGTVSINTAGSPYAEIVFRGVKDPYAIEQKILKQIKK